MKRRVLIIDQYFYPESFRINELGYELAKRGYHVDALVGIPNYPDGNFYDGYGVFRKRTEIHNGVHIYRCFQIPRKKASNLMISLNYLSYLLSASLWILFFFVFKKKYNAIIGFQMSPITQVIPGILLKKLRGTKMLTWVQDIWPDSIIDNTSPKQNKLLLPILDKITEYVYKNSDKLLISSKGMKRMICRNNDYSDKIEYTPNWCDDFFKVKSSEFLIPNMPDGFIIMMAGNIVESLDPVNISKCIELLKNVPDIQFVFIGGGSYKEKMEQMFKDKCIKNAHFYGRFPYDVMPLIYNKADAMLLSLASSNKEHLNVTVPSRLQSYMSAGKPIYAMIGAGAREIIESADCGFVVDSGDYRGLANIILQTYLGFTE